MLGLTMKEDELVPVEQDPEVQKALEHQRVTLREQAEQEVEERRLIRIVLNQDDATEEEREEARSRLSVKKGTQNLWFLEGAQAARDKAKQAERALQDAVGPAKERLIQAATARIAALTKQMHEDLEPARERAIEIEQIRHQMGDRGAKPIEHPCAALLPDGAVDFQLRIARLRGWIS